LHKLYKFNLKLINIYINRYSNIKLNYTITHKSNSMTKFSSLRVTHIEIHAVISLISYLITQVEVKTES